MNLHFRTLFLDQTPPAAGEEGQKTWTLRIRVFGPVKRRAKLRYGELVLYNVTKIIIYVVGSISNVLVRKMYLRKRLTK